MYRKNYYDSCINRMLIVASHARQVMEKYVYQHNIKKYGHDFDSKSLDGWCAFASARLYYEMIDLRPDIKFKICVSEEATGERHAFVAATFNGGVYGHHIVDITATQYGRQYKEVEIVKIEDQELPSFWKIDKSFKSINTFREYQIKDKWEKEQIFPYTFPEIAA